MRPGDVELSGSWRARVADEETRRAYPEVQFDDADWDELEVPGPWHRSPAFATTDGPLLLRHAFDLPSPAAGQRCWLTLDGLFYQADVWLDGGYLGDVEGYFAPHRFEFTERARSGSAHVLALELVCARTADRRDRRSITGAFQPGGDEPNPGGLWRPVRITTTGPVALTELTTVCTEAGDDTAVVTCTAVLDAETATAVLLRTRVGTTEIVDEHQLAAGTNRRTWTITVERPALWWPRALGEPTLHDLELTVIAGSEDAVSDSTARRVGLRRIAFDRGQWSVNGERLFVKGGEVAPTTDAATARAVVERAAETGLDLLRLTAHIGAPELYERADELGILLWQDFPLTGPYARGLRRQATGQAVRAVEVLGHHPSVALWCAHDDAGFGPSVLDTAIKRAIEKVDPSRPVITHADGLDEHTDLGRLAARIPRTVRFVHGVRNGHDVETLRRIKYRPTGGFCLTSAEAAGAAAPSIAPVIVVADPPRGSYRAGDTLALDVHVVSDLRVALTGVRVSASVSWPDDTRTWTWEGDIDADACVRVGRVEMKVPEGVGACTVELDLVHHGAKAGTTYHTEFVGPRP